MNAHGKVFPGEACGDGDGRAGDKGYGRDDEEPIHIGFEFRSITFGYIALFNRKRRNDGGGAQEQVVGLEEFPGALEHCAALGFGLGYFRSGEGQALLDVPDDFGLELGAVVFEKAAHAHGIGQGAERLGAFHGLMEIRVRLLDDDARLFKLAGGLHDDAGHFRIDWADAEIAADGDPLWLPAGAGGFQVRGAVRWKRNGIGGFFAHHGVEEKRQVFDIAGHGAFDAEG